MPETSGWILDSDAAAADYVKHNPVPDPGTCSCNSLPCVFDAACADTDTHPYRGLGCGAEGQKLCRFAIMDCDGDSGNAEHKQPCYEDKETCTADPGALGCNAVGNANLRFCGFGKYKGIKCPGASPAKEDTTGVPTGAEWVIDKTTKEEL